MGRDFESLTAGRAAPVETPIPVEGGFCGSGCWLFPGSAKTKTKTGRRKNVEEARHRRTRWVRFAGIGHIKSLPSFRRRRCHHTLSLKLGMPDSRAQQVE